MKIARIFNTYGPRMHPGDGRVVSNFIVQALRGDAITIYRDGGQTRSFCYVNDLVEGITPHGHRCRFYCPMNLGSPAEFAIRQLAKLVLQLTGSRSPLIKKPLPQDDPRQRNPDVSLAIAKIGWNPKVTLEDGLARTVRYFEGLLSEGPSALEGPRGSTC
jgi:UDP-glucuronate decarboxylase